MECKRTHLSLVGKPDMILPIPFSTTSFLPICHTNLRAPYARTCRLQPLCAAMCRFQTKILLGSPSDCQSLPLRGHTSPLKARIPPDSRRSASTLARLVPSSEVNRPHQLVLRVHLVVLCECRSYRAPPLPARAVAPAHAAAAARGSGEPFRSLSAPLSHHRSPRPRV